MQHGNRGVLVTEHELSIKAHKTLPGNQLDLCVAWCNSNIVEELKQGPAASDKERAVALKSWLSAKVALAKAEEKASLLVSAATFAEEQARMTMAKVHQGGSVAIEGKSFHPSHSVNKAGEEVIHYLRTPGAWQLDTV